MVAVQYPRFKPIMGPPSSMQLSPVVHEPEVELLTEGAVRLHRLPCWPSIWFLLESACREKVAPCCAAGWHSTALAALVRLLPVKHDKGELAWVPNW